VIRFTGIVHPWLCDSFGHLNTRHYVAMFDDATHVLIAHLGYRKGDAHGWVDVRNEIDYLAEVRAGAVVEISSSVTKLGTKSVTLCAEMRSFEGSLTHSRMQAVIVYFDLSRRCSARIPDEVREKAAGLAMAPQATEGV
jgi:acyl-CoA thioester hydrolase